MMTSPTTQNKRSSRGFTLIELCVVLVIISVILALAFPRYGGFLTRGSMRSEARRLAAMARYLSSESSRQRRVHYLNFDVDKDTYWVTVDEGKGRPVQESTHLTRPRTLPGGIRFKDVTVFAVRKKNAMRRRVAFYPGGENDEALIHFSDYGKDRFFTLHIKPYNGHCALYDDYFKGYGKLFE